jgi:DNA helicase-2/ATP-dependent DNA helicase PcrA
MKTEAGLALNQEQKQAVTFGTGPLLVVAGAGTGKTAVITSRVAWLINKKKVTPSAILALTFTDKAAAEMEKRVDKLVPYGYIDTWISTFHAFGDRVLREHALDIGLSPNFQVLTQPEQAVFLRERFFTIDGLELMRPLSGPTKHIQAIIEHISHLKDELVSPDKYLAFATRESAKAENDAAKIAAQKYLEIAKIYAHYQQWMAENDQIDFGDQINLAIKLWRRHPDVLKKYQKQFEYCLVDEFQDTNTAQNELLKLLFGPKAPCQNITVVGDDDQSIYQFRGAAVQNIIGFQKTWPDTRVIVLNKNFRSQQSILDAAYSLIQHNNPYRLEVAARIDKKLRGTGPGPTPEFTQYDDDFFEAKAIAEHITSLIKEGLRYRDIAILVRANSQAEPLAQQLRASGIPYVASGASGLYDEPIVRLLISFLKVISDYDDHLSLYYLATSEVYDVDVVAMTAIIHYGRRHHLHFRDLLTSTEKYAELSSRVKAELSKLQKLNSDIEKLVTFAREHNVGEVLYRWLVDTELLKKLNAAADKDLLARVQLENIAAFYEKIKNFVRASENTSAMNFVANLRLLAEAGENPAATSGSDNDIDAITIATVHGAKGLEWPVVFLPSLAADRFPSRHRQAAIPVPDKLIVTAVPSKELHIQEERRLFYVALTRAKQNLYLSVAKKYGQGSREKKISQFVHEALGNIKLRIKNEELKITERLSLFETTEHRIAVKTRFMRTGDTVNLNPHQIDDYLTCPKKFDYIHILKLPILQAWAVAYGNAIHQAIGYYFTKKLHGDSVSIEEVINTYYAAWRSENFVTREHEEQKKRTGEKTLVEFVAREEKAPRKVMAIEEKFDFGISGTKISGRYDVVIDEAGGKLILDFKTSDVTEEKKAEERVKQSTQMQIYALSEETMHHQKPHTALYFVESGIVARHQFSDKEIDKIKENIKHVTSGIKKENFDATPDFNKCHWCAYKDICPSKYKGA